MMNESNGMKTHTSVTVTTDPGLTLVWLNIGYFKTTPGIIKLVQLVRLGFEDLIIA